MDPVSLAIVLIGLPFPIISYLLVRKYVKAREKSYGKFVSRRASLYNSVTDAELRAMHDGITAASVLAATSVIHS